MLAFRTFPLLLAVFFLSSCAVIPFTADMTAKNEGTTIEELRACKTRNCLLLKDVQVLTTETDKENCIVEVYKARKKKGTFRRVMYGLSDATRQELSSTGLPVKRPAAINPEFFSVKAVYDKDENIKKVELLQ